MQILNHCNIFGGKIINAHSVLFASEEQRLNPFLKDFYKHIGISYPKFYKMDEHCKLGFIAAEVLLQDFALESYENEEIAMVSSNSESTLATDIAYWESTRTIASPALFVYTLPNIMMGEIAIRNNIKGENIFFVAEKFDAKLLFQQTELVFKNTSAKIAIVGWVNYENEEIYLARLFLILKLDKGIPTFNIENLNKL